MPHCTLLLLYRYPANTVVLMYPTTTVLYHPVRYLTLRPLHLPEGRHPLLERQLDQQEEGGCAAAAAAAGAVANDTYISEASCLHVISGPNMSGKSTYLKQVP